MNRPGDDPARPIIQRRRAFAIRATAALTLVLALSAGYRGLARTILYNSDHANILLQAQDLAAGNLALRGWTLSNCSFYPETVFYALALMMNHSASALMRDGAAFIYAILVLVALWLTGRGSSTPSSYLGYAIAFPLIALPQSLQHLYIAPGTHISTMILVLAALISLSFTAEKSARAPAAYVVYFVLMATAVFGDPFAIYIGAIPIAAVAALRWVRSRFSRHGELLAIVATLGAVIIGIAALKLISGAGGFRTVPIAAHFVARPALRGNAAATFGAVAALVGLTATPGAATPLGAILLLARAAGLMLILGCCAVCAYRVVLGVENRTNEILLAALALDILEYLFSDRVVGLETVRYLVPSVLFGAVLAGRIGASVIPRARISYAAVALFLIAYLCGFVRLMTSAERPGQTQALLAQWLYQHGLVSGYGDYWDASSITVESAGQVKIRAVVFGANGVLLPYHWESKDVWYSGDGRSKPPNFLLLKGALNPVKMFFAARTFGPPAQTYRIQGYIVMVWNPGRWIVPVLPPRQWRILPLGIR
ncbi:MAG TPA: hypothetical protein VNF29_07915 [Candidatus Binataceae bacterium]|nr:hypothetical protein [Candidatus Binataceae bacterium]